MTIAVLGGGIQGCTVALELADRGFSVELFEATASLMTAASRNNEGKIHLGFVYAADPTLRTARLMMRGATEFAPRLRLWLGSDFDRIAVSSPFKYAVHRHSQRTPEQLEATYTTIASMIASTSTESEGYFGRTDANHLRRLEADELGIYGSEIIAAFETAELAIDPEALADSLRRVVMVHPGISTHLSTRVVSVDTERRRIRVDVDGAAETAGPFVHIVNCSWAGRPAIDATTGILPPAEWSFRQKYFLRVQLAGAPISVPSTTVVLGPFGDVVNFGHDDVYVSWYPVGRRGWSTDLAPPDWPAELEIDEGLELAEAMFAGLSDILPSLGSLARTCAPRSVVRGGVIFALGNSDLADPASRLHERHDVGPRSVGTYHTIDTGKLTLAPMFAAIVGDRIEAARRG